MTRLRSCGLPLVALLALAAAPPEARAARVLTFTVTVDGRPRLAATDADTGEAPPEAVWHRLTVTELSPADGAEPPAADPANPLRATLRGKVVVEVSAAGRAEATEVRLVRRAPTAGWTVAPEDVDRLGRSIGLAPPAAAAADEPAANPANPAAPEAAQGLPLWVWVGGAVAAALFAVGLMIRLGMNQSPPSRLEFPRTFSRADLPPEPPPADDYYPDDPSAPEQS